MNNESGYKVPAFFNALLRTSLVDTSADQSYFPSNWCWFGISSVEENVLVAKIYTHQINLSENKCASSGWWILFWYIYGSFCLQVCKNFFISSAESQKGAIADQRCSVENQKGVLPLTLYSNSTLLVLNGTSLSCNNALMALNWRYVIHNVH